LLALTVFVSQGFPIDASHPSRKAGASRQSMNWRVFGCADLRAGTPRNTRWPSPSIRGWTCRQVRVPYHNRGPKLFLGL